MKELFPGYYPLKDAEIKNITNTATIVFGASVLLDLFRISHSRTFLSIIKNKVPGSRLWLPYDSAWLYHNRLPEVISQQIEENNNASRHLTAFKSAITNKYGHPFISQDLMGRLEKIVEETETSLENDRKYLLTCFGSNDLKLQIDSLFSNRIGNQYDETKIIQVCNESELRFKQQLPPCCTFSRSKETRIRHNRYIIWKQILQYAKESEKPVCLVLNRITTNWFYIYKDSFVAPNQYLINEFKESTGQDLWIMSAYDYVKILLNEKEKEDVEINKLLSQLHNKPTLGNNQQIDPINSTSNSI